MKKFIFILVVLLISLQLEAQSTPRVAVLPFESIGVSKSDSLLATNYFELSLVQTGLFNVIEQNQIDAILSAQSYSLSGCTDDSCAIEIGELLSAEQILISSFSKLNDKYVVISKLIDVTYGSNIKTEKVEFRTKEELIPFLDLLAYKMAGLDFNPKERLVELRRYLEQLQIEYVDECSKANVRDFTKYLFGGLGVALIIGSGVTWYLGYEAYKSYDTTLITSEAILYREQSELYDIIKFSAGGVGLCFSTISIINFFIPDNRLEIEQKINNTKFQIAELEIYDENF